MLTSQIRASMLSGECRFMREFWDRKQYRLVRQFQDCVKRRATLSLAQRMKNGRIGPDDPIMKKAGGVIDSVWDSCFSDTRPFDEIYR
jgi:inner membrane protease ATP23